MELNNVRKYLPGVQDLRQQKSFSRCSFALLRLGTASWTSTLPSLSITWGQHLPKNVAWNGWGSDQSNMTTFKRVEFNNLFLFSKILFCNSPPLHAWIRMIFGLSLNLAQFGVFQAIKNFICLKNVVIIFERVKNPTDSTGISMGHQHHKAAVRFSVFLSLGEVSHSSKHTLNTRPSRSNITTTKSWFIWLKYTWMHLCTEVSECDHSVTQTFKQHFHTQLILVCPGPVT